MQSDKTSNWSGGSLFVSWLHSKHIVSTAMPKLLRSATCYYFCSGRWSPPWHGH